VLRIYGLFLSLTDLISWKTLISNKKENIFFFYFSCAKAFYDLPPV